MARKNESTLNITATTMEGKDVFTAHYTVGRDTYTVRNVTITAAVALTDLQVERINRTLTYKPTRHDVASNAAAVTDTQLALMFKQAFEAIDPACIERIVVQQKPAAVSCDRHGAMRDTVANRAVMNTTPAAGNVLARVFEDASAAATAAAMQKLLAGMNADERAAMLAMLSA